MKIIWTRNAKRRLADILDYIEKEFGIISREHLRTKTKDFTILLKEFPEIGTLEVPGKQIRGFQLTRQTRVFYRLKDDRIIILTLFDSRQDPNRRPR